MSVQKTLLNMTENIPLVIDLDHSFARVDYFHVSLMRGLSKNPFLIFYIPLLFIQRGREGVKSYFASFLTDDDFQPSYFRPEIINFLHHRKVLHPSAMTLLATGAAPRVANKVAEIYNYFDAVFASSPGNNLKSKNKFNRIHSFLGNSEFFYIGDSWADLELWKKCKKGAIINAGFMLRVFLKSKRKQYPIYFLTLK